MYELNVTLAFFSTVVILVGVAVWLSPMAMVKLAGVLTRRAAFVVEVRAFTREAKQRHGVTVVGIPVIDPATTGDEERSENAPVPALWDGNHIPAGIERFVS